MWVACAGISVLFCVVAWIMKIKKNEKASWASASSLSFVAITLLMEYRMVLNWVNTEDWTALQDVVPSTFVMLCGYVIIMILANIFPILKNKNDNKS